MLIKSSNELLRRYNEKYSVTDEKMLFRNYIKSEFSGEIKAFDEKNNLRQGADNVKEFLKHSLAIYYFAQLMQVIPKGSLHGDLVKQLDKHALSEGRAILDNDSVSMKLLTQWLKGERMRKGMLEKAIIPRDFSSKTINWVVLCQALNLKKKYQSLDGVKQGIDKLFFSLHMFTPYNFDLHLKNKFEVSALFAIWNDLSIDEFWEKYNELENKACDYNKKIKTTMTGEVSTDILAAIKSENFKNIINMAKDSEKEYFSEFRLSSLAKLAKLKISNADSIEEKLAELRDYYFKPLLETLHFEKRNLAAEHLYGILKHSIEIYKKADTNSDDDYEDTIYIKNNLSRAEAIIIIVQKILQIEFVEDIKCGYDYNAEIYIGGIGTINRELNDTGFRELLSIDNDFCPPVDFMVQGIFMVSKDYDEAKALFLEFLCIDEE